MALAVAVVTLVLLGAGWGAGYSLHPVLSGSMEPAIRTGALALTRPVDPAAVTPGMVITYQRPEGGTAIAHRVLAVEADASGAVLARTKGDANNAADPAPVPLEGTGSAREVAGSVPLAGHVAAWLRTPGGWLFVAVVFGLLLAPDRSRRVGASRKGADTTLGSEPADTELETSPVAGH